MGFKIEFTPIARDHLKALRKRDQQIVIDAIERQLIHVPNQPETHRKPLQDNPFAPWELRIGDLRVFYDIDPDNRVVIVLAIGRKHHNRLQIGGEEIEL